VPYYGQPIPPPAPSFISNSNASSDIKIIEKRPRHAIPIINPANGKDVREEILQKRVVAAEIKDDKTSCISDNKSCASASSAQL
jgi:hypothetical protein